MKNTKVCLINPPFSKGMSSKDLIPLGLSYVAGTLIENGFDVVGYNMDTDQIDLQTLKGFKIFGLFATTAMMSYACNVAKKLKSYFPDSFVILGGPHASSLPDDTLKYDCFDAIAISEGELTMLEIANAFEAGQTIDNIQGIGYRREGKHIITPRRPFIPDLDLLPFPAKHIFDHGNYPSREYSYANIIGSRGCPFRCTNCQPGLNNVSSFRVRKVEKVIEEMKFLMNSYGVNHFVFYDSELYIRKEWIMEFCKAVKENNFKMTFEGNARIHLIDDEILDALKSAGCVRLAFGVESGSQRVVNEILCKGVHVENSLGNFDKVVSRGIEAHAWFMLGIPGEKWEDVLKTIDVAKRTNADTIEVNIATPWPDTKFYVIAKQNGWLLNEDYMTYNEKVGGIIQTPYLSVDQVYAARELFKNELKKAGYIHWGTDCVVMMRPKSVKQVINLVVRRITSLQVGVADFRIFKDWVFAMVKKVVSAVSKVSGNNDVVTPSSTHTA